MGVLRTISIGKSYRLIILLSLGISVGAIDTQSVMNGAAATNSQPESLIEQFKDALTYSTKENIQSILEKAIVSGLTPSELKEIGITEGQISTIKANMFNNKHDKFSDRPILINPYLNDSITTQAISAGVEMPDYALWPRVKKQQTNTWCSAATVETVLNYVGLNSGTIPTQSKIMDDWKKYWNVTYPDLPLMRNYIRDKVDAKCSTYIVFQYAGNRTDFNQALAWDVLNYQPMIILMSNKNGTSSRPYKTSGHFCLVNGYFSGIDKYFIGDPFYFDGYVSGAPKNSRGDQGEHNRTWAELNFVITEKFGNSKQTVLF